MANTEPAKTPEWASDESNNTEPSQGQKETGWTAGQDGVSDYMNWWQFLVYAWVLFFAAVIHWKETWRCATADLGAGASAIGTSGWGYQMASADSATIQNPTALHVRRHGRIGNNNGVGNSRFHSNWIHWHTATSKIVMEGKVSVSGYGTSTGYSIEWGVDCASNEFIDRIVIKKTNASANWFLHVSDPSGTSTYDTGIVATAGSVYNFKITAYTGTATVYINGVNVGAIAGSVNYPANEKFRFMFQCTETGGGTLGYLRIEPFDAWFDDPG